MSTLPIHYDPSLVVVSVSMSICSSFAALLLSDGMRAAATVGLRRLWLASGSLAMGAGIWSMHFLGMLALRLPVPVYYFWPAVLLSMVFAVAASCIALHVVSTESLAPRRLFAGGLLMGGGIGAMHYTGMAAMRSSAMERYNPWIVALSVLAAAGFSWLALWIAFASRKDEQHETRTRVAASVVMGLGIAAMHYTAMIGVRFTLSSMPIPMAGVLKVNTLGESLIAMIAGLILLVAFGTSILDKWRFRDLQKAHSALMQAQAALLKTQEELREANAMLNELSVRDGLTGLYNRRYFDSVLDTEWRRAGRTGTAISIIMMDVDSFKALNDHYGHQRGDACLRDVARALEEHPRRGYDVLARYGGEEFVLLLPGAKADAAYRIAESIRAAVHALGIEHQFSTAGEVVTISIGVCCDTPRTGDGADGLVREADAALYAAKRLGKNRVEVAGVAVVA